MAAITAAGGGNVPDVKRSNPDAFKILAKRLKELEGKVAKAGWFESAVYPTGTPVATVAAVHEFGAPAKNIPPRPFMRPTIARESNNWKALMASGAKAIIRGNATIDQVLNAVGAKAAGDVAKTIASITAPPLKAATIAARARKRKDKTITATLRKPLVDTALMINSVTHLVEDE